MSYLLRMAIQGITRHPHRLCGAELHLHLEIAIHHSIIELTIPVPEEAGEDIGKVIITSYGGS